MTPKAYTLERAKERIRLAERKADHAVYYQRQIDENPHMWRELGEDYLYCSIKGWICGPAEGNVRTITWAL